MSEKTVKKIDHLMEDEQIPRQNFCCISFLSPENISNCSVRGLKVRGVFDTKEQADAHAKQLQAKDPDFHVFVGEIGKWLPWDPDPNSVPDQVYKEEQLQDLMAKYKENQKNIRDVENNRKNEMKKNHEVDKKKQETIERLRNKLKQRQSAAQPVEQNIPEITIHDNSLAELEQNIETQETLVKFTQDELANLKTNNEQQLQENLDKINSLYQEVYKQ